MNRLARYTIDGMKRTLDLKGRSTREEIGFFLLGIVLIFYPGAILWRLIGLPSDVFMLIKLWLLAALLAAMLRRVRDAGGRVGWAAFGLGGVAMAILGLASLDFMGPMSGQDLNAFMVIFIVVGMTVTSMFAVIPGGWLLAQLVFYGLGLAFAALLIMVAWWCFQPSEPVEGKADPK